MCVHSTFKNCLSYLNIWIYPTVHTEMINESYFFCLDEMLQWNSIEWLFPAYLEELGKSGWFTTSLSTLYYDAFFWGRKAHKTWQKITNTFNFLRSYITFSALQYVYTKDLQKAKHRIYSWSKIQINLDFRFQRKSLITLKELIEIRTCNVRRKSGERGYK